jgi:hypothetical protein
MKLQPWHQRVLVGGGTIAILLAAASDEWRQADPGQAYASAPIQAQPAPSPQPKLHVELERLGRQQTGGAGPETDVGNAFGAISWYVPPPPPPPPKPTPPPPPPPPTAPPLPYSYLGRYVEDGRLIILLVRNDRIYTVSEGEVLDNTYRVERLARGWLEMTYLPLNIRQTLATGET